MRMPRPDLPDIYAGGWRLRTGLPIPETLSWLSPQQGEPDVTFVAGRVPAELADPPFDRSVLQIAADGTALARFDGIANFLIEDGRVTCDLEVEPDAPELVPVIFGNVLACICWRRRQLALHASAVAIDGKAVLLPGPVATGKSVLAEALARRGHVVLTDEVAVVRDGLCFPCGAPLQLADDALAAAGIDPAPLPLYENFPIPKRHWNLMRAPELRPYPIAAVFRLSKGEPGAALEPVLLAGEEVADTVLEQYYWKDMLTLLDSRTWAERDAEVLADRAAIYRLAVPRSLDRIGEAAELIERTMRAYLPSR